MIMGRNLRIWSDGEGESWLVGLEGMDVGIAGGKEKKKDVGLEGMDLGMGSARWLTTVNKELIGDCKDRGFGCGDVWREER